MVEGGEETASTNRPTVFISYASQDAAVAKAVVGALERAGLACWIAPRDVVPGALYADEIVRAINDSSLVVLVLSAQSVVSPHVGKELERASSKRRRIIALRTDAAALPRAFEYFLSESQWIEVGPGGIEPAAAKLAEAVRRHLGSGSVNESSVVPAAHTTHSQVTTRRWRGMPIGVTSIAVLALLLIAGGIQWALTRVDSAQSLAHTGQTAQAGVSLAVLPFVDMSPEHNQEYFSDGLAEELLNELAQIKELRVSGRTSSFSFKGKNEDLRVIGEKLGVSNILEGSVRKEGNHLRITAQLINAKDGTHLWSQTFDRELSGVFAVQEDIAMAVSGAMSVTLDVGEMSRANGGTTSVAAYDKYLQALALQNRSINAEGLLEAATLYREALSLDPTFARAWYNLFGTLQSALLLGADRATTGKEMNEVVAKLTALAPDSALTQSILTTQFVLQRKWSEADAAGRIAGENGLFLMDVGRAKEALEDVRRGMQREPLSILASFVLQNVLDEAGRPEEAQAEYQRSKGLAGGGSDLNLDFFALMRMWSRKDADPAAVKAQLGVVLAGAGVKEMYGITPVNWNNRPAAIAALRHAFEDPANQTQPFYAIADHYGEKAIALAALRHAFERGEIHFNILWVWNESGLRADPRFKDILRDLGLVDYYRTSGKWPDYCKPVGKDDFECH